MVLKGLEVLTGTVSDLCLSGHELPLVLLKTSEPVVHVCLYAAQLTFGIPAFQSAAHGTSCLPPELNDARRLILDKIFISHIYVCVCSRAVHTLRKTVEKLTHTLCSVLSQIQKSLRDAASLAHKHSRHISHKHVLVRKKKKKQTTEMGNLISCSTTLYSTFPYLPHHAGSCGCSDCMWFWRGTVLDDGRKVGKKIKKIKLWQRYLD